MTIRGRLRLPLLPLSALLLLLAGLFPSRVWAQFDQYTAPGGSTDRPDDRQEQLERDMEEARWRLGPVHVDPWASLYDVEYYDNAFGSSSEGEETADVTATVGAGLRAYLPAGPDVVIAAHALPEYVWWNEAEARRRLNGRYGAGVFGFWNRASLEATARRDQQRGYASPEQPQPINIRGDRAGLALQVLATGRIALFASVEDLKLRNLLDEEEEADPRTAPFERLDRDERILRGGLRYSLPRRWTLGLGVERTEVDFLPGPPGTDRSNEGTSPLVQVQHESKNSFLSMELTRRTLDPTPGSSFVPYEETAGTFLAGFNTTKRLAYSFYGRRGIVYALADGYSYLEDDRLGAALQLRLGWRTGLRLYGEAGREDYAPALAGIPERRDDLRAYGANLSFEAVRRTIVNLRFTHTGYDSNLPGADRTLSTFGAGLSLGGRRASW